MVNCQYWQTDIFDTQNGLGDSLVYMAAQGLLECHVTMSYIITVVSKWSGSDQDIELANYIEWCMRHSTPFTW